MRSLKVWVRSRGAFGSSVTVLAGGAALGQSLVVLASPLLARLYVPEDFGVLAVYISLLSILTVVASLRYEVALPLPEEDETAANLLALSLLIVLGISLLSGIGVWLLDDWITHWTNTPALKSYLWLLPLSLLGAGTYQVLNYWAIRKKAFARIAQTKISQSLGQVATQLGLGLLKLGPLGLLLGDVVARASGSGTLATLAWRQDREVMKKVSTRGIRSAAHRYRSFPVISTWSSLLSTGSYHLPVMLLSFAFGATVVGWFAFSLRVLQTPVTLIGQAAAQVFFAHAGEANRQRELGQTTLQVYKRLVSVAAAPFFLLGVAGAEFFATVFGEIWRTAGVYSQWIAPWLFLVFITSPLSSLVFVLDRQREELYFQASLLGGRMLALLLGAYLTDATVAIQLYGASSTILWLIYMLWLMNISGNSPAAVLTILAKEISAVVPLVAPVLLAKLAGVEGYFLVGAGLLSLGLVGLHVLKRAGVMR